MRIIYTCPICGYDLQEICLASIPAQYYKICLSCGWQSSTETEKYVKIPYVEETTTSEYIIHTDLKNVNDACKNCSNHPSNGGSGICHCTLGSQITW